MTGASLAAKRQAWGNAVTTTAERAMAKGLSIDNYSSRM
jgi:hypothetical protein